VVVSLEEEKKNREENLKMTKKNRSIFEKKADL